MTEAYVLETGAYEQRGVSGVFSTLERAQAAGARYCPGDVTTWKELREGEWLADRGDSVYITRYRIDGN